MKRLSFIVVLSFVGIFWWGCALRRPAPGAAKPSEPATMRPYQINGRWYHPRDRQPGYAERGVASWYGAPFHGKRAASGEKYNMYALTAAHRTLPMNLYVKVTSEDTGKSVIVRINDRGPFVKGRVIDLSRAAAEEIGLYKVGTGQVRLEVLGYEPKDPSQDTLEYPDDLTVGDFYVQVGAFKTASNAERLKAELSQQFDVEIQQAETAIGLVQRVRVGPYNDLAKADKVKAYFEDNGYTDAFVIASAE